MLARLTATAAVLALTALPAFAQNVVEEVEHAESDYGPFYATAEFWVLVAFVIFVIGVARPVWKVITTALDGRAEAIRAELDEAQRLREEAQHTLAEYQRKQRNALKEAEDIVTEARAEADRIAKATQERTDDLLKRREQQAIDMIAAAEARALSEVRALAAEVAIDATRRMLISSVEGDKGDALIENAIREVPQKLN